MFSHPRHLLADHHSTKQGCRGQLPGLESDWSVRVQSAILVVWPRRNLELATYSLSVEELADWLTSQGEDLWWTIDGEQELAEKLKLPCPTDELAAALRARGGTLLVVAAPGQELPEGEVLGQDNLERLAVHEGDARVFQLAWDGGLGDVWVLVEDKIAKEAIDAARE